jgi:hypothetical protein
MKVKRFILVFKNFYLRFKEMLKNKVDKYLERASNFSQVLLVALAIFGYFYTIRPIYQNQLLSEDISKKELELRKIKVDLVNQKDQLKSIQDSIDILTIEKSKLEESYRSKLDDLNKKNFGLREEVENKESMVKNISSNIIKLNIRDYIERIQSIANSEIYIRPDEVSAQKWIEDYKNELVGLLTKCIKGGFGYGRDYGTNRLPDSVRIYLEEQTLYILTSNKSKLFNNYNTSKLQEALNQLNDARKICDTAKISREIQEINLSLNKEIDLDKKIELSKQKTALYEKQLNCLENLFEPSNKFDVEIMTLKNKGVNEFISLLKKELRYKNFSGL